MFLSLYFLGLGIFHSLLLFASLVFETGSSVAQADRRLTMWTCGHL